MRMVAALALSLGLLASGSAHAMTYRIAPVDDRCVRDCAHAIVATGPIDVNEPQRLIQFLSTQRDSVRLSNDFIIASPGGNLAGALTLGLGLRRLGLRTIVGRVGQGSLTSGVCASACVFVLMAGRDRVVTPGSRVAVHAPKRYGGTQRDIVGSGYIDAQAAPESVADLLQTYAGQMGVDPALVALANSVPHESARFLSHAEMARFRLVTGRASAARKRQPRA